eukprot:scaffold97855_cov18-Prasinocladus_malaysianus.AAC.2
MKRSVLVWFVGSEASNRGCEGQRLSSGSRRSMCGPPSGNSTMWVSGLRQASRRAGMRRSWSCIGLQYLPALVIGHQEQI